MNFKKLFNRYFPVKLFSITIGFAMLFFILFRNRDSIVPMTIIFGMIIFTQLQNLELSHRVINKALKKHLSQFFEKWLREELIQYDMWISLHTDRALSESTVDEYFRKHERKKVDTDEEDEIK